MSRKKRDQVGEDTCGLEGLLHCLNFSVLWLYSTLFPTRWGVGKYVNKAGYLIAADHVITQLCLCYEESCWDNAHLCLHLVSSEKALFSTVLKQHFVRWTTAAAFLSSRLA